MNNKFWEPETQGDSLRGLNDLRHSERSEESQYDLSKNVIASECEMMCTSPRSFRVGAKIMSSLLGRELERGFNFLLTYLPTNFLTCKRCLSRIIRVVAGVTSGSNLRAGFAIAHTAPYRKSASAG